jgi:predicted acylesterase/phospholipase RssA
MQSTFDEVFATSAGAMNAAYFLSGQPDLGISIYYQDLVSRAFFNPWRIWKIVNVDYVFDHVVVKSKPLDTEALHRNPSRLFVAAIDHDAALPLLLEVTRGPASVLTCLKAATAVPVLYNRRVVVNGKRCMDGGLLVPFPILDAIAHGCTHILVLLTRPAEYICPPWGQIKGRLLDLICSGGDGKLWRLLRKNPDVDLVFRNLALGRSLAPGHINIATICPEPSDGIKRTETDKESLWHAACVYAEQTLRLFGRNDISLDIARPH